MTTSTSTTFTTPAMLTMLVAWLWQGVAIALLTAITLRWMKHVNAATRHAIWWLALVAVVLLPIIRIVLIVQNAAIPPAPSLQTANEPPIASAVIVLPALSGWVVFGAAALWFAAATAGAARIAIGLRLLVRLERQSRPFDADREARLPMWMSVRRSGRWPELRVTDLVCGACALGTGRPTILISDHLLNALDDEALDQIVMHEHAHLARFDDWSRLAQAIITTVAGLHPAVQFISRQIDLEREAACDDLVVSRTGAAHRYAACLADAAAISVASFDAAAISGAIGSRPMLVARVGRLLGPRRHRTTRVAPACGLAGVLLFTGIVFASTDVAPVVMFLESRAAAALDSGAAPSTVPSRSSWIAGRLEARPPVTANKVPVTSTRTRSVGKRSRRPSPPPAVAVATEQIHAAPAATSPIVQARTVDFADMTMPLDRRLLQHAYTAPAAAPYRARSPDAPAARVTALTISSDAPWSGATDAGVAIGSNAKRAGLAIGDFFTRAGKAIGKRF